MDKLQYDSLYKFLVSLGIILFVLPFAALIYLFNVDPILISQLEFDVLSEFSLQMIEKRNELLSTAIKVFPVASVIVFLLSIMCTVFGVFGWYKNQKKLDKKLDDETTIQALSLLEMSSKEINAKVEKEANEATTESNGEDSEVVQSAQKSVMAQYREIEDYCFKYFVSKYGREYCFKRDIRIGSFDYDLIGVSRKDKKDLIVEIKYWRASTMVLRGLIDTCRRLNDACDNYKTIAHRDFSGLVFVVTPDDQLSKIQDTIDRYLQKALYGHGNRVVVKCVGESIVK